MKLLHQCGRSELALWCLKAWAVTHQVLMLASNAEEITTWMAWAMLIMAPVVFVALVKWTSAPYGRYSLQVCLQRCALLNWRVMLVHA